jgi:hypothetical protein
MQQDEWVWGPLRLVIGILQMALAVGAGVRVFLAGLDNTAWVLIGTAMASTLVSRLLYGGGRYPLASQRSSPRDEPDQ